MSFAGVVLTSGGSGLYLQYIENKLCVSNKTQLSISLGGVPWEGPSESVKRKKREKRRDRDEEVSVRNVEDTTSLSGRHCHGEMEENTSS